MTPRILILVFSLLVPLAGRSIAQNRAGVTAIPASMLQDQRTAEYEVIIAESQNSQIQIDLEELSQAPQGTDLAGLMIRAIAEDGTVSQAVSDRNGRATLAVKQQPTVLTATGDNMHMAVLTYPREVTEERPPRPVTIPLLKASPETLLRNIEGLGPPRGEIRSVEFLPLAETRQLPSLYYQTQLSPAGDLRGRVVSVADPTSRQYGLGGMNVSVLQFGRVLQTAITEQDGQFVIRNLEPGLYGVIATGRAGYGAFGFEALPSADLLPAPAAILDGATAAKPVSLRQLEVAPELTVPLVPPQMVPAVIESIRVASGMFPAAGVAGLGPLAPLVPLGAAGAGFGPGGGGSGGGGGGVGGGIGGLIVPALIAGGIIAAVEDDDDDDFSPPPASPAFPDTIR